MARLQLQEPRGGRSAAGAARPRGPANGLDRAASKGFPDERGAAVSPRPAPALQEPRGGRQQVRRKRQHVRAPAGENGLDRAASKGFATSVAATMARLQLYKNHGADGSKSDESASTRARAGENGLDRAASKGSDERRRDDGAAPALQEPRGGRQQVRRKRQHVRAGRRERPRPRCLQGIRDERRRDDGAAPALQEPRGGRQQVRQSGSASARAGENGLDRAASKVFATSVAATTARLQLYKNHGADGSKSDESASTSARAGENGLDRAASKVFATSVAATTARLQLYKNHGADGSKSDESASTSVPRCRRERPRPRCLQGIRDERRRDDGAAPALQEPRGGRQQVRRKRQHVRVGPRENGLDRAASRTVFATSVAATMARLQLYKNHGADGLYADAFDSETTKGAAKAELDLNKYQAGGVRALHAIEQVSYVQYENW